MTIHQHLKHLCELSCIASDVNVRKVSFQGFVELTYHKDTVRLICHNDLEPIVLSVYLDTRVITLNVENQYIIWMGMCFKKGGKLWETTYPKMNDMVYKMLSAYKKQILIK